jgi:NTE family protein
VYLPHYQNSKLNAQQRYQMSQLKRDLLQAKGYAEWKEIALELDKVSGLEAWKYDNDSPYYAAEFIAQRLNRIKRLQAGAEHLELAQFLREGLSYDIANIAHPLLFSHTFIGSKKLIEDYVDCVSRCFAEIATAAFDAFSLTEKIKYFQEASQAYGQPLLMFSGGATLGLFHSGVCKALMQQDLLPKVFSGSSAGALMTGVVATKTDTELRDMIDGDGFYEHVFKFRNLIQILRDHGGIADIQVLKHFLRENLGEYTFSEAFAKSGRHASIVVAPYEAGYSPGIMNEITAPDLLVWSATLASCAVPVLFPPVRLTTKRKDGVYTPYMASTRWVDGSVRSDLPQEKMARLYNINYSIASQVNPHVVPFMQSDVERYRQDLRSWPKRFLRNQSKNLTLEAMDFLRARLGPVPIVQKLVDNSYGVMGQRYYGDINIVGDFQLRHYGYMLKNPNPKIFKSLQQQGERATWPKISSIEMYGRIGKTLDQCLTMLLAQQQQCLLADEHGAVRAVDDD